jgi:hypothetical protein
LPLSEVQERSRGFQLLFERIDTYFKDMPLTCTVGSFPEAHSPDYCWGGCPGALQEAINIFLTYHPDLSERMRKVRYVVGKVEGPLNLEPDEKVLFIGDCTSWEGEIDGKPVKIESMYGARRTDPMNPPSNDMILKILSSLTDCAFSRGRRYVHATGCPVSVAAHINYLSFLAGIPNVNFDMRNVIPVNIAYLKMRLCRALHRCG